MKSRTILTMAGLAAGLAGTLAGIYFSSAIDAGPAVYGTVTAVWFAVGAGIVAGTLRSAS